MNQSPIYVTNNETFNHDVCFKHVSSEECKDVRNLSATILCVSEDYSIVMPYNHTSHMNNSLTPLLINASCYYRHYSHNVHKKTGHIHVWPEHGSSDYS